MARSQPIGVPKRPTYQPPRYIRELTTQEAFSLPLEGTALLRAPTKLYAAGDVNLLRWPARVSIVGARKASDSGRRRAARLARLLCAHGVVVVSGLAKGIDVAAHQAALEAKGRTIAVIGTPLDRCYPSDHGWLQQELCERHLVVSQFEQGQRIYPAFFPARNRTMAMLSHASVIVEASDSSGSLSQAAETHGLGRPLFIMRSILENRSLTWPSAFLAHGARILEDVEQVLEAVRHNGQEPPAKSL